MSSSEIRSKVFLRFNFFHPHQLVVIFEKNEVLGDKRLKKDVRRRDSDVTVGKSGSPRLTIFTQKAVYFRHISMLYLALCFKFVRFYFFSFRSYIDPVQYENGILNI